MLKKVSYFILILFLVGFLVTSILLFFPRIISNSLSSNLLLVSLTGAYVVLTYLILESNNELKEVQFRPYVVFSLPVKKGSIWLNIENIGKTPAYNLEINLDPKLDAIQFEGMKNSKFLEQSYLRPNEVIKHPVAPSSDLVQRSDAESIFNVSMSYEDHKGKSFGEDYVIDTTGYVFENSAQKFNGDWLYT